MANRGGIIHKVSVIKAILLLHCRTGLSAELVFGKYIIMGYAI